MFNTTTLICNIGSQVKNGMTPQQVIVVQRTWKTLRGVNPEILGDVFYSKLFIEMPALKRLFKNPMEAQYKKLMDMISMIVGRLQQIDEVTDNIQQMAKRHVGYGVKKAHYKLVGTALLWTLQQGLANDWNEEVEEAWLMCYNKIAGIMIQASECRNYSS